MFLRSGFFEPTKGGAEHKNLCMTAGSNGTWYCYDMGIPIGSVDPDHTNDGQTFYAYRWNAAGDFQLKFGDAGDEQIPNVGKLAIHAKDYNKGRIAEWVDADKQYYFSDVDLATKLIEQYNNGVTKFCIFIGLYEGLVIDYDYNTILIGKPNHSTIFTTKNYVDGVYSKWSMPEAQSSFKLYRDTVLIYNGTDTEYMDLDAVEDTEHTYKLEIYDTNGVLKKEYASTGKRIDESLETLRIEVVATQKVVEGNPFSIVGYTDLCIYEITSWRYVISATGPVTNFEKQWGAEYDIITEMYIYKLKSNLDSLMFGSSSGSSDSVKKIIFDDSIGTVSVNSLRLCFANMALDDFNISKLSVTGVRNIREMFSGFTFTSTNFDISHLDFSEVTNMRSLFAGAVLKNLTMRNMNMQKVKQDGYISYAFSGILVEHTLDLSGTTFPEDTYFHDIFSGAGIDALKMFDTVPTESVSNMFRSATINCIDHFNTTSAKYKTDLFMDSHISQPDATAQADLADSDGANWVNADQCPDDATSVTTHVLTPNSLDVVWADPGVTVDSYRLTRDGVVIYEGTDLHYIDNVSIEEDYSYELEGLDSDGDVLFYVLYNHEAVTNYELIHITNNTGGSVYTQTETLNGYGHSICGEYHEGYFEKECTETDIEILYIEDTLDYLAFWADLDEYGNGGDKVTFNASEVFKSKALTGLVPMGVPNDEYIDVSHLTELTGFYLANPVLTEVPEELKHFPAIEYFTFYGCRNMPLVNLKSVYPNLKNFVHYWPKEDESIPDITDSFEYISVYALASGSYLFSSLANIEQQITFSNCNFTETDIDNLLGMMVNDGLSNINITLSNSSDVYKNAAPTSTGEGHIDTLRANGCTVDVEGDY